MPSHTTAGDQVVTAVQPALTAARLQLYVGLVARSEGVAAEQRDALQQGSPQHLEIGTFPGNSWCLVKFLLSELILPGVMSVCSVNDLQGRQLLPRQLVASALQISQENYPSSRNCNSNHHQPTVSAAGFRDNPHF